MYTVSLPVLPVVVCDDGARVVFGPEFGYPGFPTRPTLQEVDSHVEDEHEHLQEKASKRQLAHAASLGMTVKQFKQKQWVERYTGGSRHGWRSTPLHRVAAKRWCAMVDSQLRRSTPCNGLKEFQRQSGDNRWTSWRTWPHLTICMDLGSDGLSGFMGCERRFHLNLDLAGDPNHHSNRDVINSLKSSKLFSFWLCMLISWNVPFGPNKDDLRFDELRATLRGVLAQPYQENVLFMAMANRLGDAFSRNGHVFSASEPLEPQIWEKLKEREWFVREGYRGNLCRFLALIACPRRHVSWWEVDEFERVACALDQNYLARNAFMQKVQLRISSAEAQAEGSTDSAKVNLEDRTLRNSCQNSIALSVLLLVDPSNRRLCSAVTAVMLPLLEWHTAQSKQLRSAASAEAWSYTEIVGGNFMKHIASIIRQLMDEKMLVDAGFIPNLSVAAVGPVEDIGLDDELAELVGNFAMALATARLKRCLLMCEAWPNKMINVLGTPNLASTTVAAFKEDYEVFKSFENYPNKDAKMNLAMQRSVFGKLSVQQYVEAMNDPQARSASGLSSPFGFCRQLDSTPDSLETIAPPTCSFHPSWCSHIHTHTPTIPR